MSEHDKDLIKITALDPGKTTGWAVIYVKDKTVTLGPFGETKDMTLVDIKEHLQNATVVLYEGFWIRPDKSRQGSFDWNQMPAPQVIGSLLTLCKLFEVPVVKQQPGQRIPGYGYLGLTSRKRHYEDALAHAMFYAVTKLQALPLRKTS
jgi:hypothetical protein